MNFQQLRYARTLAECGSFVEAAKRCAVTQPTLSNGIAQLEKDLGQPLFARTTRIVQLTEFGRNLLPSIADVLNAQSALVARARGLLNPEKRLIRIGVSPLVGIELVGLIVEPFLRSFPNVEIIFREMNLVEMAGLLAAGQLEFVFGPVDVSAPPHPDWRSVRIHEEPLGFVAAGQRRAAESQNDPVVLGEIAAQTFVMVPDTCGLAKVTRSIFRQHRMRLLEYPGQAMSYRVLQEWAQLGIGAAILPRSKIAPGAGADIVAERGDSHPIKIAYEACWCGGAADAREVHELGGYLGEIGQSLASGLYGIGHASQQ